MAQDTVTMTPDTQQMQAIVELAVAHHDTLQAAFDMAVARAGDSSLIDRHAAAFAYLSGFFGLKLSFE